MPTTIAFRFPWGRYHGTPWGRNVNEGEVDFPPECWRILRALYATWKNRLPDLDSGTVHSVLEALAIEPSYAIPEYTLAHTRHYMPDLKYGLKGGSTDKAFDNFAVFERDGEVLASWPADLSSPQREVLSELCEELPYLGRAESACQARLLATEEAVSLNAEPVSTSVHANGERVRLLVPDQPLDLESLTMRTVDIRRLKRLDPPGTHRVSYAVPEPATSARSPFHRRPSLRAEVVRFSVVSAALPSRNVAVGLADALRSAAMSRFGRPEGAASQVLSGKDGEGRPLRDHRHAHYLAFASDPKRSRGGRLVDTLVVWAPGGMGQAELAALGGLSQLAGRNLARVCRPVRLGLEAVGEAAECVPELVGPSREWASLTPFAPARHGRRNKPWEDHVIAELARELSYRGFAPAASIEVVGGDWLSFRRYRLAERLPDSRRAIGVRLRFKERVGGPLSLGALSHFGLGLFGPVAP